MSTASVSQDPLLVRKRKMLLLLPVFIIPFLALFFWAFGGGKSTSGEVVVQKGINTVIPATTNAQILSKEEAYKRAISDSLQRAKEAADQNYVYGGNSAFGGASDPYSAALAVPVGSTPAEAAVGGYGGGSASSSAGRRIDNTIGDLQREAYGSGNRGGYGGNSGSGNSGNSDMQNYLREQQQFTQAILGNDPVYQNLMKQSLGGEKQDTANVKAVAAKEIFTPVQAASNHYNPVSRLSNSDTGARRSRFYSGTDAAKVAASRAGVNTISGVIHTDQTIKEGAVVKIRLTSDINMAGLIVPKNSFVYAVANLGTERLNLVISSITYQNSIYPVKLLVYDVDGLPGIHIPGTMDQNARSQATQQIINGSGGSAIGGGGVTVNSNPNFGSQIASQVSGSLLESGKQLLSRKVAIQKVFLKANYQIFLKQSSSS